MKFNKICLAAVAASMLLGASVASADTAKCYKNPGNNNGHRYVVDYGPERFYLRVHRVVKERWDVMSRRGYVFDRNVNTRRILLARRSAKSVCRQLFNYNYASQR
jgi:hypothetical protein